MKRKLALLLAVVMMLGIALPSNLMAATSDVFSLVNFKNYNTGAISPDPTIGLGQNSVFYRNPANLSQRNIPDKLHGTTTVDSLGQAEKAVNDYLVNDAIGGYLQIRAADAFSFQGTNKVSFYVTLENALWAHYENPNGNPLYATNYANRETPITTLPYGDRTYGPYLEAYTSRDFTTVNTAGGTQYFLKTTGGVTQGTSEDMFENDDNTTANPIIDVIIKALDAAVARAQQLATTGGTTTLQQCITGGAEVISQSVAMNWQSKSAVAAVATAEKNALTAVITALWNSYTAADGPLFEVNGSQVNVAAGGAINVAGVYVDFHSNAQAIKRLAAATPILEDALYPAQSSSDYASLLSSDLIGDNLFSQYMSTQNKTDYATSTNTYAGLLLGATHAAGADAAELKDIANYHSGILWADMVTAANPATTKAMTSTGYNITTTPWTNAGAGATTATSLAGLSGGTFTADTVTSIVNAFNGKLISAQFDKVKDYYALGTGAGQPLAEKGTDIYQVYGSTEVLPFVGLSAARANEADAFKNITTGGGVGTGSDYMSRVTSLAINNGNSQNQAIPYEMVVDVNFPYQALITINASDVNGTIRAGDLLVIPMVIKVNDYEKPVKYSIANHEGRFVNDHPSVEIGRGGTVTATTQDTATTATVLSVANAARGRIYLGDIAITEKAINIIRDGSFFLMAPAGYEWVVIPETQDSTNFSKILTDVALQTSSGQSTFGSVVFKKHKIASGSFKDYSILQVSLYGMRSGRSAIGTLTLKNLALAPLSNDPELISNFDTDLQIRVVSWGDTEGDKSYPVTNRTNTLSNGVTGIGNNSGVQTQTGLTIARRVDWSIGYTAGDIVPLYSGRRTTTHEEKMRVAKVTVQEQTLDAWVARKDTYFTVTDAEGTPLDGVKISSVWVKTTNLKPVNGTNLNTTDNRYYNKDKNDTWKDAELMEYKNASFTKDGHSFILTDLYTDTRQHASAELTFALTAEPNFEGPVYIKMHGSSIAESTSELVVENGGIVQVAEFFKPANVEIQGQDVQIGFQSYNVANVKITETWHNTLKGGFIAGGKLQLAVGEYGQGKLSNYMYFAPITSSDVVANNDAYFTMTAPVFNNNAYPNSSGFAGTGRVIEFTVGRGSQSFGAELTINNLALNIDRNVPYGDYDLLVGGTALVQNWQADSAVYFYDTFDIWGIYTKDVFKVATEGANVAFKAQVLVTRNSTTAYVDGVAYDLEVPPRNIDGRFYIPLRFVSTALGVEDRFIQFDNVTRQAVIRTENPARTVVFEENSEYYWVDGVQRVMEEDGVICKAFIDPEYDRIYIPFRFLGYAFGIEVDYDPETETAIFNPSKNVAATAAAQQ